MATYNHEAGTATFEKGDFLHRHLAPCRWFTLEKLTQWQTEKLIGPAEAGGVHKALKDFSVNAVEVVSAEGTNGGREE